MLQILYCILLVLVVTGCSHHDAGGTGPEESVEDLPDQMVFIKSRGSSVQLGSRVKAKFTYDFYLGKHEVTCAEYGAECDENLPVSDVTFFDAVLYANALSKEQGFDTAYSYEGLRRDGSGHVTALGNFWFHPDVKGYRLPTEAEWMFAASKNFNPENSWNGNNSDYRAHEVCSRGGSLCDMAGNVAEWVFDWSHKLADTTVVNFTGPAEPNGLEERILKGGNFRNQPQSMNIENRKDTYVVTSSSYGDYVGFRVAFGVISDAKPFAIDTTSIPKVELDADSAGMYYVSGGELNAMMLRFKMELLWRYCRQSNVVVLGSSRSLYGIHPLYMDSSLTTINMSHYPNSLFASDFLLRNYVLNHVTNLKFVVLSIDFDMWWRDANDSYDNFFLKEYRMFPGYVYDESHHFWKDGYPEGLLEKTKNAPGFDYYGDSFRPTRGFIAEPGESWEKDPAVDYDIDWVEKNPELYQANLETLRGMIQLAKKRGVYVIGVIFPQSPGYRNTEAYGRYGPRRSVADSLVLELEGLSDEFENFILMDEHKGGNHDYSDEMAANRDHLNEKGAKRLSGRLDSLIATLR